MVTACLRTSYPSPSFLAWYSVRVQSRKIQLWGFLWAGKILYTPLHCRTVVFFFHTSHTYTFCQRKCPPITTNPHPPPFMSPPPPEYYLKRTLRTAKPVVQVVTYRWTRPFLLGLQYLIHGHSLIFHRHMAGSGSICNAPHTPSPPPPPTTPPRKKSVGATTWK